MIDLDLQWHRPITSVDQSTSLETAHCSTLRQVSCHDTAEFMSWLETDLNLLQCAAYREVKEHKCAMFIMQDANGRTMITPWTKDVNRDAPHPEYPRPQMQRKAWQNLNGQWEFDCTSLTGTVPNLNETLKSRITVPFPVESYLSGQPAQLLFCLPIIRQCIASS